MTKDQNEFLRMTRKPGHRGIRMAWHRIISTASTARHRAFLGALDALSKAGWLEHVQGDYETYLIKEVLHQEDVEASNLRFRIQINKLVSKRMVEDYYKRGGEVVYDNGSRDFVVATYSAFPTHPIKIALPPSGDALLPVGRSTKFKMLDSGKLYVFDTQKFLKLEYKRDYHSYAYMTDDEKEGLDKQMKRELVYLFKKYMECSFRLQEYLEEIEDV